MTPVYFGCWESLGHGYFRSPDMRSVSECTPFGYKIDCKLMDFPSWTLLQRDGWTAVGRSDRSVDSRPGSISVFIFPEVLTMHEAVHLAASTFPAVFKRAGYEL